MKIPFALLLLACLLGAGCQRSPDSAAGDGQATEGGLPPDSVVVETPNSERTWAGLLPCSDCQGIDTRLVLRSTGGKRDYQLTETYVGGQGRNSFTSEGNWVEVNSPMDGETVTLVILDPGRSGQRFALQPDGALEMLDGEGKGSGDSVVNRLQRL